MKTIRLASLLAFLGLSANCTTTYDAYGSPRQSVDPGVALMGVAAAGLVGYALANDDDDDCDRYGYGRYSSYRSNRDCGNSGYYGGGYVGGYGGAYGRGHYGGGYSRGYTDCY